MCAFSLVIADQGTWRGSVLRGYYGYHAVHDNLGTAFLPHRDCPTLVS
jgi:hypothetical protein